MTDYIQIFTDHINRILNEYGLGKRELAEMGGISSAFMTALTRGEANPTLKTMQALAEALGIPLPLLLRPIESDEWQAILSLSVLSKSITPVVPEGYARVSAILSEKRAEQVKQWERGAKKKLKQLTL